MTKVLVFDFWGTLVEQGVWSPTKQIKKILNIKGRFAEYVSKMQQAMMTSTHDTLKDAFVAVAKEFNIEPTEHQLEELVGMWNKAWMLAKPYEDTIIGLQKLKEDYKIILVANTDNFSVPKVLEKFNMNELFDHTFFSYEVSYTKGNKEFFEHIFATLGVEAQDCLMIGDSIQSDIVAAERVAMPGVLIDRRNSRDYKEKIVNLEELKHHL